MEVRIKKIKNSTTPNCIIQVQEAGAVSDFLEGHSNLSGGIRCPIPVFQITLDGKYYY